MSIEAIVAAVVALLSALGWQGYTNWRMRRRDDADRESASRHHGLSVVEAEANSTVLHTLLEQMNARIAGYEQSIRDMQESHARDIAEVKTENRSLERQVADLRRTLQDYQLGNRVPRGYALLPLREVYRIRERAAGVLESPWYPGEDASSTDPSVIARITPIVPPEPS